MLQAQLRVQLQKADKFGLPLPCILVLQQDSLADLKPHVWLVISLVSK